jgi:hypothetical protein
MNIFQVLESKENWSTHKTVLVSKAIVLDSKTKLTPDVVLFFYGYNSFAI